MGRVIGVLTAVIVVVAGGVGITLYSRISSFDAERVTDDVHVIFGQGGNVGVLATQQGAVIVDTMTFRLQGRQIRELAERLAGGATQAILNTHYHWDHTHGNPAFPAGARIISTRRTLDYLKAFDADYWTGETAGMLPRETFDDRHEMSIGGKTIRSFHLGPGHTGGDLVVLFVEDRVLLTGDLLFHGSYPRIDLEAGGSLRHWIETLDRILLLDFLAVVPGHGAVTDRAGLLAFRSFLADLWKQVEAAASAGRSLEETLASVELVHGKELQTFWIPFVARRDRESVIRSAWEEATGKVGPAPISRPQVVEEEAS